MHPKVYAVADFYRVVKLKALCVEKFTKQLPALYTNDTLAPCIREIYASTTSAQDPLRKALVYGLKNCTHDLRWTDAFRKVLVEVAEFSGGLVLATLGAYH